MAISLHILCRIGKLHRAEESKLLDTELKKKYQKYESDSGENIPLTNDFLILKDYKVIRCLSSPENIISQSQHATLKFYLMLCERLPMCGVLMTSITEIQKILSRRKYSEYCFITLGFKYIRRTL